MIVTNEHRQMYREEGYFILEKAIDPATLRQLQDESARLKHCFDEKMRESGTDVWDISHYGKRYFISSYHTQSPILERYLFSELMAEICRATLGPEVFLFQEQFVIKGAEVGMKFSWHQDGGWFYPDCPPYVTVWAALDDMTEENGTIYVLPWSHMDRRGWIEHKLCPQTNDRVGYDGPDPGIPVFVPAGSIVVFSNQTLHRSGPNVSPNLRRAYLAQYSCAPILNRHFIYADYADPAVTPDSLPFFARRFLENWEINRRDTYPLRQPYHVEAMKAPA
ncbi:MAG TPA: phytanoyl-CoA dioxygenase family protein [Candidatus Sumerlaeota bacterium]|nr:MAG: Phytanoyl-CoA dioxygenase (PhyH) [candidate division BRC1 bacterium ADurb.BinA292]HOE96317.1 phytanoyl-CoA dioxygenase family protein [Candidatus Sumerlaeota bacterium]HOR27134.1 phytanoyl-CoA dioxygenase family protein [Candidatus Sumerlaeota bacterium]HPK02597.1 phytanoyl-CoA dioxygenase family protein [Candidatus Sumerlaeota bacterium]